MAPVGSHTRHMYTVDHMGRNLGVGNVAEGCSRLWWLLRQAAWRQSLHQRTHVGDLPGRPNLVFLRPGRPKDLARAANVFGP